MAETDVAPPERQQLLLREVGETFLSGTVQPRAWMTGKALAALASTGVFAFSTWLASIDAFGRDGLLLDAVRQSNLASNVTLGKSLWAVTFGVVEGVVLVVWAVFIVASHLKANALQREPVLPTALGIGALEGDDKNRLVNIGREYLGWLLHLLFYGASMAILITSRTAKTQSDFDLLACSVLLVAIAGMAVAVGTRSFVHAVYHATGKVVLNASATLVGQARASDTELLIPAMKKSKASRRRTDY